MRKLKGQFEGSFRLRMGKYRIIYRIIEREKTVEVIMIIHRGKGY
ncbi:type II toxin-antitoxin system RelE/ParE family toxin [bacterium]|nr:type II toxin-antitoxin system RelE/ParE family toxin [bacterium]